jgi:hypothetical protein
MSTTRPLPVRARASTAARARVTATPTVSPERIAFCGEATSAGDHKIHVVTFCWPLVANAWTQFTQAWEALHANQGERLPAAPAGPRPSWLQGHASQLGARFTDTTAQESTVAALLGRGAFQFAIGTFESPPGIDSSDRAFGNALADCLTTYASFLKSPGRRPCSMLIARAEKTPKDAEARAADFLRCRSRVFEAGWLDDVTMRFWETPREPLPLELANVAAASVARHIEQPDATNPIFDALLTKLSVMPSWLARAATKRK